MRLLAFFLIIAPLIFSCNDTPNGVIQPRPGPWRIVMDLNGSPLPFTLDLVHASDSSWEAHVHNASEDIRATDIDIRNDSVFIRMPLFDSEFKGILRSDSVIEGRWYNYLKGPDYSIPFVGHSGSAPRFPRYSSPSVSVEGSWRAVFSEGTPDAYNAIGLFRQDDVGEVTGTFMTETGDYRYLSGAISGDSLLLSCFDGSHAFLFKAALRNDTLLGTFTSGVHWQEPWRAVRDEAYRLRDPDSLTALREGYNMVDFRFMDTDGRMVSSSDIAYQGKPMMVQVMGSWCPNCVDEARLLREVHEQYHQRGLEVVAIAFEKQEDPGLAVEALRRFKVALGIPYPILYGGTASKEEAGRKLPFLDHLMSYPTCIFIDRKGVVRRIRTGFYGPGTGEHYEHYKQNLGSFIEKLLAEGA